MYNGKTVGIAISAYIYDENSLTRLKECIESLLITEQIIDYVYITDDCSIYTQVFEFYATLPRKKVRIIKNHHNRGIAAMKNLGLRLLANCDYILLADCDVVFYENWDTFYIENMEKTGLGTVSTSNVFGSHEPFKTEVINGVEVDYNSRFHGIFICCTKDTAKALGGFPILPERYGQEHYNFQVRAGRHCGFGHAVADFKGGNQLIKTVHVDTTFINGHEKRRQSIRNAKVSDSILKRNNPYMYPEIEKSPRNGQALCLIIGHRESTPDRILNLNCVLDWYKTIAPEAEIIVVEQDAEPVIEKKLRHDVNYVFAYNKGSYNRSWGFNIAAVQTSRSVLVLLDNDVILKKNTLYHGTYEKILEKKEFDLYRPYWKFLDLNQDQTENFRTYNRFDYWNDNSLPQRCPTYDWLAGGAICISRQHYLQIGGFNEGFRGWGGEDDEFMTRARKLIRCGKVVHGDQYDFNMYHLHHERTVDCTANQPHYQENVQLMTRIGRMNKEALDSYIFSQLRPTMGKLDKYRNE